MCDVTKMRTVNVLIYTCIH